MRIMTTAETKYREVFDRSVARIENTYGLKAILTEIPAPYTADTDGASIFIDPRLGAEETLFAAVHLFGHAVEWNTSETDRALGVLEVREPTEALLATLLEYERRAARYSLQLLHETGVRDLDQWLSDYAACDSAYLFHFYRTGEKREFRSFWLDGAELLVPLPIPDFRPTKWISRSGIVI
jgi:hypothetical protein